jgi:3-oxoacyl-[acyl-carrier protein] reductase
VARGCDVGIGARNKADVEDAVVAIKAKGVATFSGAVDVSSGLVLKAWVEGMARRPTSS